MSAYQPNLYTASYYVGDAFPRPPLLPLMTDAPNAAGATGVIGGVGITYASSIDAALATLAVAAVWDVGCAAAAIAAGTKLPMMVCPYTYDGLVVGDPWRALIASRGYVVLLPVTRGRGLSPGAIDDSGRELYDFKDAFAAVAATLPHADGTKIDAMAYSGGAANFYALVAKYPGLIRNALLAFGWGDYGTNPLAGRSFWGSGIAGYQALMTARIGNRVTQIERYRARCVWPALRFAMQQSSTRTWTYWDQADPIGAASQDVRMVIGDAASNPSSIGGTGGSIQGGSELWQVEESRPTSPIRWSHGLPDVGLPNDLYRLENLLYRYRTAPAPSCASVGEYHVPGHLVHGAGFEVWTAPTGTAAPRTTALGGTQNCCHVRFNANTGLFYVTPLDGPCAVQLVWNGVSEVHDVSAADTLFDLSNP